MSISILSDIHGNATALDAVLSEIEQQSIDKVVCLGDVAGSGPQPVETVERLKEFECPVIQGNVDEDVLCGPKTKTVESSSKSYEMYTDIDVWCSEQLMEDHRTFIKTFRSTIEIELESGLKMVCYHGSPRSHSEQITVNTPDEQLKELFEDTDADIFAGGHTHTPFIRRFKNSHVLNPGSVGLPYTWDPINQEYRHPAWAEYAVITGNQNSLQIELRRCPIDNNAVINAALESGMPHADRWVNVWKSSIQ